MFTNPFRKVRCPFCNHEFYPSEGAVHSSVNSGKVLAKPPEGLARVVSRMWLTPLDGPMYTSEMARRQCPTCKKLLPLRFEVSQNFNIAIIGDTISGKSHYIAAFIHQLEMGGLAQIQNLYTRFAWLGTDNEITFKNNYYEPLFEKLLVLPATQSASPPSQGSLALTEPLVFQLAIRDKAEERYAKNFNITIYDISGEDIADPMRMVQFAPSILQADAIIYLADPLSMPGLVGQLPAHLQPSATMMKHRLPAYEVLRRVMFIFDQYKKLAPGELAFQV